MFFTFMRCILRVKGSSVHLASDDTSSLAIEVRAAGKTLVVTAATAEERDHWLKDLQVIIEEHNKQKDEARKVRPGLAFH